ncbi:hypothetical protein ACFQY7_37845 [Actinomadura luteofluorescens]|uniref:hypothetical protein n=1 Tax=Actinomadura luteofluorescens TaxID=46163 RepID=UPI003633C416
MQRRTLLACAVLAAFTAIPAASVSAASAPSAPDPSAPRIGNVEGARTFVPDARNAQAVQRFRDLHRSRLNREQIHHFWGVEPAAGSHDGMTATHSVDTSYRVSNSADFTYTPTIKSPGPAWRSRPSTRRPSGTRSGPGTGAAATAPPRR